VVKSDYTPLADIDASNHLDRTKNYRGKQ